MITENFLHMKIFTPNLNQTALKMFSNQKLTSLEVLRMYLAHKDKY